MRKTSSLKSVSLTINWGGGGGAMLTQFESDRAFYAYNSICIFDLILNLNTSYT